MWFISILVILAATSYASSQETDECKCVLYYQCNKDTRTVITDGAGIIGSVGERIKDICECKCPESKICCRLVNAAPRAPSVAPSAAPSVPPSAASSVPPSAAPSAAPSAVPLAATSKLTTCGVRNPDGVGFKNGLDTTTVNTNDVAFGEFPWFVDILLDSGAHRCGGTLIHPSVVLTAAHCVVRKKTYIVRAGDYDNLETNELLKHQDRIVSSIKIHENYNPAVYHNDVALLFLSGSFDFNNSAHIQPACLAPSDATFEDERCYVVGRGKDDSGQFGHIARKIDLPLVEKSVCQTKLRQTRLTRGFSLHPSALCAGGEKGKDSCVGDGGGPLVCPIAEMEEKFQQIGIVSWGIGCREDVPAVYTNVQYLRSWIDKAMKDRSLDVNFYIHSV